MDNEHQELKNDIDLVKGAITGPFYWLSIGLGLLMILPLISSFPDYGVTYWHVFASVFSGIILGIGGHRWVSWRFNRRSREW